MFSLIIVLISILLVAAIAVATIYYGGETTTKGRANAEVATLLAQAAQIASASAAFTADRAGLRPSSLEDLLEGEYLSSIPDGWQNPADPLTPITSKVIESYNACELFNARQGIEGVPSCDDLPNPLTSPVCCQ